MASRALAAIHASANESGYDAFSSAARAVSLTHGYLQDLHDNMARAVEDCLSIDEACAQADWSKYELVTAFEEAHRSSAYSVFLRTENAMF